MSSNSEQLPLLSQDNSSLNNKFSNDDESMSSYNTIVYYSSDNSDNISIGNQTNNSSLLSIESGDKCRICLQNIDNIVMYCKCLDTLSHIHEKCLFTWLNSSVRSSLRKEEYDNHDEEYSRIYNILNQNNKTLQTVNDHYFYCEICHYRYNFFNQIIKTEKLLIIFDILLGLILLGVIIYSIVFMREEILGEITITFMINLIFLIMFIFGTIGYSAYIKFYNYKLVIYPHHSKIE